MMRAIGISLAMFLLSLTTTIAQDVTFRSINSSKSLINPSLIDVKTYGYNAGINYRQSISLIDRTNANRLYSAFAQGSYEVNKLDRFSFEFRILQDNPSTTIIRKSDITLTASYKKKLFDSFESTHSLSVGLTTGVNMLSPVNRAYWFGSQYDIEDQNINLGLPSGEIDFNSLISRTSMDLSLGLSWHSQFKQWGDIYGGIAIYHLVPYNQALFEGSQLNISRRYSAFMSFQLDVSGGRFISTPMVSIQDPFLDVQWRNIALFNSRSQEEVSFGFGLSPRVVDDVDGLGLESISLLTLVNITGWQFEFSYDFATGDIAQFSDGRGSIELGASYYFRRRTDRFEHQIIF